MKREIRTAAALLSMAFLLSAGFVHALAEEEWADEEYEEDYKDETEWEADDQDGGFLNYSLVDGTVVVADGPTVMGMLPDPVFGWDSQDVLLGPSLDCMDAQEPGATRLLLPSTLKTLGYEAILFWSGEEIVLPEGVESMYAPFYGVSCERVILPSTLETIVAAGYDFSTIDAFVVSLDNPWFCTRDGVLFTKDMTTLVWYPNGKTDLHYDIPSGVKSIGPRAFNENEYLQSVSMPIGLQSIGDGAFDQCGRLQRVNVPLTVTEIGSYAFANCVSLQQVTLPPALQELLVIESQEFWDEEDEEHPLPHVFMNCPALNNRFEGDNGATEGAVDHDSYIVREEQYLQVIANPENAQDRIPVYETESTKSHVITRLKSGSVYEVIDPPVTWSQAETGEQRTFYIYNHYNLSKREYITGYVLREDVLRASAADQLFEYSLVEVRPGRFTIYNVDGIVYKEQTVKTSGFDWIRADVPVLATPWVTVRGFNGNYLYGDAFVGDVDLYRIPVNDGKTYGIVVAAEPGNRVHLRAKADKNSRSLERYFSGTPLEILSSANKTFWKVSIQGQVGYMMKEYVKIVPEKAAEPGE